METLKKLMTKPLFFVMFMIFSLSGCVKEGSESNNPNGGNEVLFTINVPGSPRPATRALGDTEEHEVGTIEILLFHCEGAKAGELAFTPVLANVIATEAGDITQKTFSVRLPDGKFDIVVFANSRSVIASSSLVIGSNKAAVLSSLTKAMPATGWVSDPASVTKEYLIPMWGEKRSVTVSNGVSLSGIYLHRMLARVDMSVTGTDAVTSKFKMTDIRVYNSPSHGRLVPIQNVANDYWNPLFINSSMANAVTGVAVKPSLSSGAAKLLPISYAQAIATDGRSCVADMYMFEANKAANDGDQNAPCVILRGTLDGSDAGWYRLDFARNNTYLDILRNHKYSFSIVSVSGTGYPTPEEALNNRASNIIANIVLWNDYDLGGIVFDGVHFLSVNPQDIKCGRDATVGNKLTIKTDNQSDAPTVKVSSDPQDASKTITWLKNLSLGAAVINGDRSEYKLNYDVEQNPGTPRTGYLHVTVGRLTNVVRVSQSNVVSTFLVAEDMSGQSIDVIEFTAAKNIQPAMQQFKLRWSPPSVDLQFSKIDIKNPFTFDAVYDNIPTSGTLNDPSGTKTYSIQPTAITDAELAADPFYERFSTVLYTLTNDMETSTKAVVLRQFVYNMIPKLDPVYLMDGAAKSFSVRSNSPFTVSLKSNPDNVVSGLTTTGVADISAAGTPVDFTIIYDMTTPTILQRDVVVTIKSPTGLFADRDVTLNCASVVVQPESNSYIVVHGGAGIMIPVSRANKSLLGPQLGDNEAFTAELVWTDNENKISAGSNIQKINVVGRGSGGHLMVIPGSVKGNAVVAIKNAANKILWSWHIWVTDYVPAPLGAGKFMDRNLGALSGKATDDINDISTHGMLYQWGRKDPFPGSAKRTSDVEPTLYTATGTTAITMTQVPVENNFGNSVANPATFYFNATPPQDWYTNGSVHNNTLWSTTSKTIYDPCPADWRVPNDGAWAELTVTNFPWANYGRTADSHGGFYPAAGYRGHTNGALVLSGLSGISTTATLNPTVPRLSRAMYFTHDTLSPTASGGGRASASSVRCVKE